ncbi:MAG: aldo/keto reductase [Lactobacillaceae bacterium]|nr:aldo/keto reductase [Lactobacillaceae bacterium]
MKDEFFTLSNGVQIPKIGFGTWLIEQEKVKKPVLEALEVGYRHIDSAEGYGNEVGVGQAVRESGLARKEVFVTTKLRAEFKTYQESVDAINKSLNDLDIDYIDLMIIHAPKPWGEMGNPNAQRYQEGNLEAWKALEEAYKQGKIRAIGVSNFDQNDIQNIIDNSEIAPMVNQIKIHIGNVPNDLIEYDKAHNILTEAYSPIAHGDLLANSQIALIAGNYDVTLSQLAIRYLLQLGTLPLPKTLSKEHMADNLNVDFTISADDMDKLNNIVG